MNLQLLEEITAKYEAEGDDMLFCAHARQDIPRLLEEVKRLRALLNIPGKIYRNMYGDDLDEAIHRGEI